MDGEQLKRDGQERALASNLTWMHRVHNLLRTMTGRVTSDDLKELAREQGIPEPTSPNGWGSAMSRAARNGIVKKTSERVPGKNPRSHAAEIVVWQVCEDALAISA